MSAMCSFCDHPTSLHGANGCRARYLVGDPACGCLHALGAVRLEDELVQCQAEYHGELGDFRCEIMVAPTARHDVDHRAQNGGRPEVISFGWGEAVGWGEDVASYPLPPDDQLLADISTPASSRQVGGDHYRKHSIQPWDIWEAYKLDAFTGAILKYLLRDKGNRLEDLRKARHTLDKLIEIEEGK